MQLQPNGDVVVSNPLDMIQAVSGPVRTVVLILVAIVTFLVLIATVGLFQFWRVSGEETDYPRTEQGLDQWLLDQESEGADPLIFRIPFIESIVKLVLPNRPEV